MKLSEPTYLCTRWNRVKCRIPRKLVHCHLYCDCLIAREMLGHKTDSRGATEFMDHRALCRAASSINPGLRLTSPRNFIHRRSLNSDAARIDDLLAVDVINSDQIISYPKISPTRTRTRPFKCNFDERS